MAQALVIDEKDWKTQRKADYRDFNLPVQANHFLQQLLDRLECGLRGVSEAAQRNLPLIDNHGIHVEKLGALDEDRLLDRARNQLLREIGPVQFPQIILDIDKVIRFSWLLLQRAPRYRQELLAL